MKAQFGLFVLAALYSISSFAAPAPAQCKDAAQSLGLRQHMVCMSYDLDNAFAEIGRASSDAMAAQGSSARAVQFLREVRRHAQMALAAEPSKTKNLKPEEARVKALEYQIILAETLATLGKLELRLMTRPASSGKLDDDRINELVTKLQFLIGEGHQKFR